MSEFIRKTLKKASEAIQGCLRRMEIMREYDPLIEDEPERMSMTERRGVKRDLEGSNTEPTSRKRRCGPSMSVREAEISRRAFESELELERQRKRRDADNRRDAAYKAADEAKELKQLTRAWNHTP